jgi:hypothetical protein
MTRYLRGFDSLTAYQMSSTESFDGLCGIIANFASSKNQIRCSYELGHSGPCSFEKYRDYFRIIAGSFSLPDSERGFIDSVLEHQNKQK